MHNLCCKQKKKGSYTASNYAVYLFVMQKQELLCSSYFGDNIKAMEDEVSLSLRKTLTSFTYFRIFPTNTTS
jgi:hypothetical protein